MHGGRSLESGGTAPDNTDNRRTTRDRSGSQESDDWRRRLYDPEYHKTPSPPLAGSSRAEVSSHSRSDDLSHPQQAPLSPSPYDIAPYGPYSPFPFDGSDLTGPYAALFRLGNAPDDLSAMGISPSLTYGPYADSERASLETETLSAGTSGFSSEQIASFLDRFAQFKKDSANKGKVFIDEIGDQIRKEHPFTVEELQKVHNYIQNNKERLGIDHNTAVAVKKTLRETYSLKGKAKRADFHKKPESKAKRADFHKKPESKAKKSLRRQEPKYKEKQKEYDQKRQAKIKAYNENMQA